MTKATRITIIGCGHVGTACAHALLRTGLARELMLVDESEELARGEALDLEQSVPLGMPVTVCAGTYREAAESAVVVITAGAPGKFQGSRLDMLKGNVEVVRACLTKLMAEGFAGVLVLATNPVDVLTLVAQRESGLPAGHVIGTGTLIDSERLRGMLGEHLGVDSRSVHASVIGEHGDSSVAVWSSAQVGGVALKDYPGSSGLPDLDELQTKVRRAGPEVAELKGNTCWAIAACVTRICEAVLRDEHSVLVVSTVLDGQYRMRDVALSTPCVVGSDGVEAVLELALAEPERALLEVSAEVLREAYGTLELPGVKAS